MAKPEVKQWITVKGRHIPLFEGESKADAIKRITGNKNEQEVKKVTFSNKGKTPEIAKHDDTKEKQIASNKAEADKRNKEFDKPQDDAAKEKRERQLRWALNHAKEKIDKESYSWKETVLDAQYEHNIPDRDLPVLEKAMKLYAMKKGKFKDYHEEWDKAFREQGVNVDSILNKNKKLEKVHEATDLLKDYKGYELPKEVRSQKNYLQLKRDQYEANKEGWRNFNKELDAARDKYITKEDIEAFGGRDVARMLVSDSEHPEIMALKEKKDKMYADMKEYEKVRDDYYDAIERLDKKQSRIERNEYGLPDFKEAVGDYIGFKTNDTGTSYYNDLIEKDKVNIVEMTPEQYIKECAYYVFENSTLEKVLRGRIDGDIEDTEKYAKMMREGVKFDTPYLNYKDYAQEGLHRAVAAYMNGIKKIPVVVVGSRR